ncbi:putative serine/threonine-protein kinase iks1 [Coniosporium apollinis]|uniref:Serine/threonine-protein kinase iks1 n=1 Tax=Coniosporium apollinis TaxID=61459 RepID=A0ABQ9NY29_9PEZI|nr:putative serine/threonine-protein kinase iks1 [Coniosporium apollinis]
MSLVPYLPAESREIVLRHGSAVVVYDQLSKQLSLRDGSHSNAVELSDCPYCHRPLRETSPEPDNAEQAGSPGADTAGFVSPEYFRMLHHSRPGSAEPSRPPSPHRRITQLDTGSSSHTLRPPPGAQFVGSSPASPPAPHGISSSAFSPNYFKTFFVEEKVLGKGGKGVVLLVRHVLDGVSLGHFACKRVPVGDDHEWLEKVLIEVQLLQNLSHQNLVSYRHVWLEDYQITTFGPKIPCAFILQQYCNAGDLHHYILNSAQSSVTTQQLKERMRRRSKGQIDPPIQLNAPRRMQFEEIYSFFKDITSGLNHLHSNGYIHRDLKPSNCLLHLTGQKMKVLVSDFGEVQAANTARKSTGATGTISYCAPEVVRRETPGGPLGNFSTKSDIFSLGMIVYFMCFGRLPYSNADDINEENEDLDELRKEIAAWAGFDDEQRARTDLPDKLYKFLKRLLSLNPSERPDTEQILHNIKAGSGFEDLNTFASSSVLEEIGPRISSADSPRPSPARHMSRQSSSSRFLPPGPSKLRQASVENHRSPSPEKRRQSVDDEKRPVSPESSIILRARQVESKRPTLNQASSGSQLLLPAPTSYGSRIQRFFANHTVLSGARITLFLLKVLSISSLCSPFAANSWVQYPLLGIATLDLAFLSTLPEPSYYGLWVSALLLSVHILVVTLAWKRGALCLRQEFPWHEL